VGATGCSDNDATTVLLDTLESVTRSLGMKTPSAATATTSRKAQRQRGDMSLTVAVARSKVCAGRCDRDGVVEDAGDADDGPPRTHFGGASKRRSPTTAG
jgi:hypothetical protein